MLGSSLNWGHGFASCTPYVNAIIVQTTLSLSRSLFMDRTGKFFETEEQRRFPDDLEPDSPVRPGIRYIQVLPFNYRHKRLLARFSRDGDGAQALGSVAGLTSGALLRPEFAALHYQGLIFIVALSVGIIQTWRIFKTPIERYDRKKRAAFSWLSQQLIVLNALLGCVAFLVGLRMHE
jgi:hypothetical protein